jgi:glycosyltransferase involved in cell wall biosynthesis
MLLDVVGDSRGMSGNARHVLGLVAGLTGLGHQVTLVCHDNSTEGNFEQLAPGIEVRAVNRGGGQPGHGRRGVLQRYWSGMKRMAALVRTDVDVICAHDWPSLRAGALASRRLDVPLVWIRNDGTPWEEAVIGELTPRGKAKPARRLPLATLGLFDLRDARRAKEIVVLSNFDAAMVRRAYRRDSTVLRLPCSESFFSPPDRAAARSRLKLDAGDFLVITLAILVPYRRFEDVIDAIGMLHDDAAVSGLISGADFLAPEYAEMLAARIQTQGLTERVRLNRRAISDAELRELYAAADVYVFPSSRQSWGLAPLEAIASGTPVIVSAGAGVSEVLAGRPGVEIVPPASPASVAAAIRATRERPRSVVEPTREWLRSELTSARYAEEMGAVLARARGGPSNPGR